MIEIGVKGVWFFWVIELVVCFLVVYELMVVVIVSGIKEVILDG